MREIRIRKLGLEDARGKLECELNAAFMAGETRVRVIHGIGTGRLKELTREIVNGCGFGALVEETVFFNPGVTMVDLFPPDRQALRMLKR